MFEYDSMSGNNYNGVFDPTSSASLTSLGLILAGACSVISSSYIFGKFRAEKSRSEYQAAMLTVMMGLVIFYVGFYVAYAYD
jgi:hypothetical protein